nr:uncharacterized protein LOC117985409 [Maniola hyperantus]
MGDCSVHFDTFDSLDYFISPVKKCNGSLETNLLFSRDLKEQTNIRLIKDFRKKIRQIRSSSISLESDNVLQTSSSSVILKKTTKELIPGQYSFVNSINKNCNTTKYLSVNRKNCTIEDKPMIKVTVIPKTTKTQTSKVFNKHRERTKKLQNTVSNQESSIKSQNVYFMVKGKRREKVFELKSTESTNLSNNFFNTQYEDISIQQITNSKRLISSLNMEKKKHKNKKTEPNNHKITNFDGTCQNNKNYEGYEGVNAQKSKVTIVGQLGLTRDDQYVLKCAATVNDKPITTNYRPLDNTMNRNRPNINRNTPAFTSKFKTTGFSLDDNDDYRTRRQDSNVQTDVCYAFNCTNLDPNRKEYRNITQATQVNFNQPRHKPPKGVKDKVAQCNCDVSTPENNTFNIGVQDDLLKDCNSPLVVISVYPRPYDKDSPVKIIQLPPSSQKTATNLGYIESKAIKRQQRDNDAVSVNRLERRSPWSRSPSPVTKTVPNKSLIDKTGNQALRKNNNMNNVSPQRIHYNRNKNSENKSKHRVNNLKKDVSCYCPYSVELGKQKNSELGLNSKLCDPQQTDKNQVKRALVNNFLRSVSKIDQNNAKMKLFAPKVDTSRVEININGDRERYDVLLEQSNFDTGLSVRKTLKMQSPTHSTTDKVDINSVENFLMLSEEIKNTPTYSGEMREISKTVRKEPRLNVRDSLEICHSREGRAGSRPKLTQIRGKDNSIFNSDFIAPVKHYRGDDCSIPDPNERDKEIRELLGIVRNTRSPTKGENVATKDHKVFYSHHENQRRQYCCCCKKRSSKETITGRSISKLAKKCLRRKKSFQGMSIASKTLLKKREAKKMVGRGTQALQKKKEVCKVAPETSSDALSDKLSTDDQRHVPDKQKNNNLSKEDVTAPHKESFIEQDLILNRNVQVFLQIEQFTNQKPIILTRKQYEKVKKAIQSTINQRKSCDLKNFNVVSVGEIKVKPRLQQNRYNREVQTDLSEIQRTVRCIQIQTTHHYKTQKIKTHNTKHNESNRKQVDKMISSANRNNGRLISSTDRNDDRKISTAAADRNNDRVISSVDRNNDCRISTGDRINERRISTADRNNDKKINKDVMEKHVKPFAVTPRQTVSSMEIHYANVAYMKKITVSTTHFGDGLHNKININDTAKPSTSLYTIFKGHKKSATPNLGTSAYSLCSDANDSTKSIKAPPYAGDGKPKKPFLRRLLSCLVMRSTETTVLKEMPEQKLPSVNSSVDSYHISTSLGALEMTSTLYDTSASFYSNHTIAPTIKMKRGFFSSVRGFLTTRRS